jgi:hypothetical protein
MVAMNAEQRSYVVTWIEAMHAERRFYVVTWTQVLNAEQRPCDMNSRYRPSWQFNKQQLLITRDSSQITKIKILALNKKKLRLGVALECAYMPDIKWFLPLKKVKLGIKKLQILLWFHNFLKYNLFKLPATIPPPPNTQVALVRKSRRSYCKKKDKKTSYTIRPISGPKQAQDQSSALRCLKRPSSELKSRAQNTNKTNALRSYMYSIL